MSSFEHTIYSKKITSNLLLGLTRTCPECGEVITSTGNMYLSKTISHWSIEYWCQNDKETFNIWSPETERLAFDIAKNH